MKIQMTPEVAVKLLAYDKFTTTNEFSGVGFVRATPERNFEIYDFVILDVGTSGWTEFDPQKMLPLQSRPDASNIKCWLHKHPIGNGVPGDHNWSGTDHNTCTKEPFGMPPEMIGWSLAVVITPGGWVGRYDDHKLHKKVHLEVEPSIRQFRDDTKDVAGSAQTEEAEQLALILKSLEKAVNAFDRDLMIDMDLDEETLWDMLSEKIEWGSFLPISYQEWCSRGMLISSDDVEEELGDWRDFTYGINSSIGMRTRP